MSYIKRDNRPEILLEEVDFKKSTEEVIPQINKKRKFIKDLKKDISFISVVSIALFAILGNVSVYMLNKNPPTVTYIPKVVNVSETDKIINTAYNAGNSLLNFNADSINKINKDIFYKNTDEQYKQSLKQAGIYDKVLNNQGNVNSKITEVNLVSKSIVHGMVKNIVSIHFSQTYTDKNETTVKNGKLILTIIENPDQENQFLISNTQLMIGDTGEYDLSPIMM